MTLEWSYNYHANNMYQQVAPIEIYVKQTNKRKNKQTKTIQPTKQNKTHKKTKNKKTIALINRLKNSYLLVFILDRESPVNYQQCNASDVENSKLIGHRITAALSISESQNSLRLLQTSVTQWPHPIREVPVRLFVVCVDHDMSWCMNPVCLNSWWSSIDDLRKSRGLHSVSAYRHGLYIYIGPGLRV